MKQLVNIGAFLLILTSLFGCGGASDGPRSSLKEIASTANQTLIKDLENQKTIFLTEVITKKKLYGISDKEIESLRKNIDAREIPKLVLSYLDYNNKRDTTPPRWVYLPNVAESDPTLKKLESVDAKGRITVFDGTTRPEAVLYPIITLSYSEKLDIPKSTKLDLSNHTELNLATASDGGLMLDRVRFEDDQEPWIKGAAEVYMVVSYIGKNGKPELDMVELPALNWSKRDYDLRLIGHIWKNNLYQIVNISFFEHDSGKNFAQLAKAFITAAAGAVTAIIDPTKLSTIAVVGVVNRLGSAIVDALPDSFWKDDDDFMDSINTIEKKSNVQRTGVSGNAKVNFSHYEIKFNDE